MVDAELLERVRAALNARVSRRQGGDIIIPISDTTAGRILDFLELTVKYGLWDTKRGRMDTDETDVPEKED